MKNVSINRIFVHLQMASERESANADQSSKTDESSSSEQKKEDKN